MSQQAESERIKIIRMDVFSCRSEYDFLNMFAASVLQQTSSKVEELEQNARDFLSRLSPRISFSADPSQEISLSLGITPKSHKPEEALLTKELIDITEGGVFLTDPVMAVWLKERVRMF